ncbi:MAG: HIRAN domain-containing protein [Tissierellia bacterium]|nr:HIRAN domain-containing protein [Tissierellia bacterium]
MKNMNEIERSTVRKFEESRYFIDFYVRGFRYYDGLEVINQMKIGDSLELVHENDNPYDSHAVAIYYDNHKIGYIPREENEIISRFIAFGHNDLFEVKIQYKNLENPIDKQVRAVIKIKDKR